MNSCGIIQPLIQENKKLIDFSIYSSILDNFITKPNLLKDKSNQLLAHISIHPYPQFNYFRWWKMWPIEKMSEHVEKVRYSFLFNLFVNDSLFCEPIYWYFDYRNSSDISFIFLINWTIFLCSEHIVLFLIDPSIAKFRSEDCDRNISTIISDHNYWGFELINKHALHWNYRNTYNPNIARLCVSSCVLFFAAAIFSLEFSHRQF